MCSSWIHVLRTSSCVTSAGRTATTKPTLILLLQFCIPMSGVLCGIQVYMLLSRDFQTILGSAVLQVNGATEDLVDPVCMAPR